jgi:peptidoglycan/xylan/chitin deacetylase (PgdA/CDA1 family)
MKKIVLLAIFCAFFTFMPQSEAGKAMNIIPTTKKAVVFAFGGLSNPQTVADVLARMENEKIRGTFFVTERELRENSATIHNIVNHGQEIGIGLRPGDTPTRDAVRKQIERIRQRLSREYGVNPTVVRQMYGAENEAVSSVLDEMQLPLIGQTRNVVLTRLKDAKSSDDIMNAIFKKWDFSLGRGQIMYFRLDFLKNPALIGEVMTRIHKEKVDANTYRTFRDQPETNPKNDSAYAILSVGDVLSDKAKLWEYPVPMEKVPVELQPDTIAYPVDDSNFSKVFLSHYIGAPEVDEEDRMYGLDQDVIRKADKSGVVKTAPDRMIFLTFDDWGTDNTINKLLYVLRKHNATGTFFIITRYMPSNPNLLRAIAEEGNIIGSHTDRHGAMAIRDKKGHIVESETPEAYSENVKSAYRKLAATVGDVKVNDHYSLSRLFRPPTLAISENGAKALFNAGYTYLVSGYESTEDYAAHNLAQLVGAIKAGIYTPEHRVRTGSIIIMHMSASAKFTPEALDIVLTQNELLRDDDPRKFTVGRLTDYLTDGYDQRMEQKNSR